YHRSFCARALDLDDAGEVNIYKIDLLEAMTMAKGAWFMVTRETIKNCWNHTRIQPDSSAIQSLLPYPAHADPLAWTIVRDFVTSDMTLPEVESALQLHLGDHFIDADWQPALKVVMDAEGDVDQALEAVDKLQDAAASRTELEDHISTLKTRKRIFGDVPTLDEVFSPVEERQLEGSESDGTVKGIANQVREEFSADCVGAIEVEDDEDDEEPTPSTSRTELIALCQQLEGVCMQFGDPQFSLTLTNILHKYRAMLRREDILNSTQTTLDKYIQC
ncbi:hypothetical protein BKA83DRAFT_99321, partial [Pisolithus microcarpus]